MYSRFEDVIKERGVSSYRVSVETGVPQSSLTRWKKGIATPKVDKIIKIAKYLGLPLEELLDEVNETDKNTCPK